jgi:hypothetical protein
MSEWSTRPRSAITPLKRFALWGRSVVWGQDVSPSSNISPAVTVPNFDRLY